MFTGIIESVGQINFIEIDKNNLVLGIKCNFCDELKIDQSIAHNGACLTVFKIINDIYYVTLIDETLKRTTFNSIKHGDFVNLERCLKVSDRLDGHFVTGHIDTVATCEQIIDQNGSWKFVFHYDQSQFHTIEKGSVTVNGISLTVVDSTINEFSVCIIPYTYEHTSIKNLKVGDSVNIEFDILGKYISKLVNNKL